MPGGVATGIGSLPGEDIDAALADVLEAFPDLPHLPELPARGAEAGMVGRTAAALVDLHVDLQPSGWRLVPRAGVDERRAAELLERDLDALVPVMPGYDGAFKVQLAGPWTLAATVELPRGGKVVADRGAVRDLGASLAETVAAHLDDVRRRIPGGRLVLQLDEPALPAVIAGTVPTESGLGRVAAVDPAVARALLADVIAASAVPVVVHCCAADVPLALLHDAGAAGVSLDLATAVLDRDVLGERIERGLSLWLGVVPALGVAPAPTVTEVVGPLRRLWGELGFDADVIAETVSVTPACGLAGASSEWVRAAMRLTAQTARALAGIAEEVDV